MKKLILITGDLAAGKSTFAGILSRRYAASMFFKDSVKEVLGDTIGFSNREENKRLSAAAMELLFHIFSEFSKLDRDLILEANFCTPELQWIHRMASEKGYEVLTLVLQGNVDILHARYLNRIRIENRHPVHLSIALDSIDNFRRITKFLRDVTVPGLKMSINADSFSYQTDEEILSQIDAFMKS